MKSPAVLLFALCLAMNAQAQTPAAEAGAPYTPDQLDQLVGPIALYPDPLVALILPASTASSDIAQAGSYLSAGGDPAGINHQMWDPCVQALAHYPPVVIWMAQNLAWTEALGAAFDLQPADVMQSIQQLRAQALAAGTLQNTPQQTIDVEGDNIRIVPGSPDVIYVPEYDPDDVYEVPSGFSGPFFAFGIGYPVGAWLGYECDWDDFGIWMGPWVPGWEYRRDWLNRGTAWHAWRPNPAQARATVRAYSRPTGDFSRPRPIAGAPSFTEAAARAGSRPAINDRAGPPFQPAGTRAASPASPSNDYRGWAGASAPAPRTPAPSSPLYGGYDRGTEARDYSARGQSSREAPVRSYSSPPPRAEAPARSEPPPSSNNDQRNRR